MSWTTFNPEEKETVFRSGSTDSTQIALDLKTVTDRMLENKEADHASSARQLCFFINATNGYIQIVWWNNEQAQVLGDWIYELTLTALWETETDAFNFDKLCRFALFDFIEDNLIAEDGSCVYDAFMKTELSDIEEVFI